MHDFHDAGHGYDKLGLDPAMVRRARAWGAPVYERYFRVDSRGAEHVPRTGPAILVANHGGVLPLDGAILWLDLPRHTDRILRPVADRFVARLPWAGTWLARIGAVSGTVANVGWLLERGAVVAIFPEGVAGPAKSPRDRYHLQRWTVGHAELAIRHRAPIVPVAIVGAEESWSLAWRLPVHAFGVPYLPVPRSPVPLPVRFRVRYGAPIELHRDHAPAAADDPAVVEGAARRTRDAVRGLLERTLAERAP